MKLKSEPRRLVSSNDRHLFPYACVLACFVSVGLSFGLTSTSAFAQFDFSGNSTEKIRIVPSDQAQRIGSAVDWQADFETALAKSAETGKPIFWYVHTLKGTFMDRKDSIDWYMRAGPFSWPSIIKVLNENFIPVKAAPTPRQQRKYKLIPYVFVEPGFVILRADGNEIEKVDRVTTLHPKWFRNLLTESLGKDVPAEKKSARLIGMWADLADGKFENLNADNLDEDPTVAVEQLLLAGMAEFRLGNHEAAKKKWSQAASDYPDQPLAWKAAAEAEGFGPFVRGFETHVKLPAAALKSGLDSPGSAAPAGTYDSAALWQRGVRFMIGMQAKNGGITDCDYDFGGTDALPNVHVAVTSLMGMALVESLPRWREAPQMQAKVENAMKQAVVFVTDDKNLNLGDKDELLWAFVYRTRFMARLAAVDQSYSQQLQKVVTDLQNLQSKTGAWFHEYPNSFVTASALIALKEAENAGAKISSEVIEKGCVALARDRSTNGSYPYFSVKPGQNADDQRGAGNIPAAAGRMPICELALWMWKKSDDPSLANALQKSFEFNENLMSALKYDDHTSRLAYGGFFFWYDLRGRSEALNYVQDANLKGRFQKTQRELILSLPEVDGCFVDSHELGRVYGTAMALLSLAGCEK